MKKLFYFLTLFIITGAHCQMTVGNINLNQAVSDFFAGNGVFISNIEFNGNNLNNNTVQLGYFEMSSQGQFNFEQGLVLSTGNIQGVLGPNNSASSTLNDGMPLIDPSDPDMDSLIYAGQAFDEAILEFDFIPAGDSIIFNYIFASEEYHEYSTSPFNDAFGFFLSGPGINGPYENNGINIAKVPYSNLSVSMNNINNGNSNTGPCTNCQYLQSNPQGSLPIQFDAQTTTLQASAEVQCGETYHLKLILADVSDEVYDSGVFLEGSSLISNGLGINFSDGSPFTFNSYSILEGGEPLELIFTQPSWNLNQNVWLTFSGNAQIDTDYIVSDTIPNFNGNGISAPISIDPVFDTLDEPNDSILMSVSFIAGCGDTITITKTIYIIDCEGVELETFGDSTLVCPNTELLIDCSANVNENAVSYQWSNGSNSSSIVTYPQTDTFYVVEVSANCPDEPITTDTVYVNILSDLTNEIWHANLCQEDTNVTLIYTGNSHYNSWGTDTLELNYIPSSISLIVYDTLYNCSLSQNHTIQVFPETTPNIYYNAGVLSSEPVQTYQWWKNSAAIPGATNSTHTPSGIGYYKLEAIDLNGCAAWSNALYVHSLANTLDQTLNFCVYPNPFDDYIIFDGLDNYKGLSVCLIDQNGKTILSKRVSDSKLIINTELIAAGAYVVKIGNFQTNIIIKH